MIQVRELRLLGTVFEEGFVCIVHAGEETTLPKALITMEVWTIENQVGGNLN